MATSSTPLVVTRGADGWRTSPFTITFPYHGEDWELAVGPARWQ